MCAQVDPELFYADKGDFAQVIKAKLICRQCCVRIECLVFAMDTREPHGVWGGLTARQRSELRRSGDWRALAS